MDSCTQLVLCLALSLLPGLQALRCACTADLKTCTSIHETSVDFQSARAQCSALGGELIRPDSSFSNASIADLLLGTSGYFWIGLKTKEKCNPGDPLPCPQRCPSVSKGAKWSEKACDETVDGFLCHRVRWDVTCSADMTKKVIIIDSSGCSMAPCDHRCEGMPNGYTCQCSKGYMPRSKDPRRCDIFCLSSTCRPKCIGHTCFCPPGFIRDGDNCTDIDECMSNHDCVHTCKNTIGSYVCSCEENYILVDGYSCTYTGLTTTTPLGLFLTPSLNYTSGRLALASPGRYIGIGVSIIAALFGLVMLLRYLRRRTRKYTLKDCDVLNDALQGL